MYEIQYNQLVNLKTNREMLPSFADPINTMLMPKVEFQTTVLT